MREPWLAELVDLPQAMLRVLMKPCDGFSHLHHRPNRQAQQFLPTSIGIAPAFTRALTTCRAGGPLPETMEPARASFCRFRLDSPASLAQHLFFF